MKQNSTKNIIPKAAGSEVARQTFGKQRTVSCDLRIAP